MASIRATLTIKVIFFIFSFLMVKLFFDFFYHDTFPQATYVNKSSARNFHDSIIHLLKQETNF